ncbi:MAG: TonB-dependent receptor [Ignavibacteriales bacterium]|nr:TonB-dependent receptor [Ignavibacteriales bacterium]
MRHFCAYFDLAIVSILIIVWSVSAVAQEKKLEELSLEDLLNVSVVTASKTAEKTSDAPGIISVISQKEIKSFGGFTLFDILERVTSVYMHGSYARPHNEMSIRGDNTEFYNTRVLILIDGRPIRESMMNGDNAAIYRALPVERIERIEIVRGPGSVLYGTTAYTGVVNIITSKAEKTAITASANAGSFGTKQALAGAETKLGPVNIAAGVDYLKSDGWDFTAKGADQMATNPGAYGSAARTRSDWEESYGGTLKLGYENLTINTFYGISDEMQLNRTNARWERQTKPKTEGPMYAGNKRGFADLGYSYDISDKWSATANVTYNYEQFRDFTTKISDNSFVNMDLGKSNDYLFEVSTFYKLTEKINIVAGALANNQSGIRTRVSSNSKDQDYPVRVDTVENPFPLNEIPQYNQTWYSGYAQADYRPIAELKLILGGQLNKATDIDLDFVPRLGAIYSFTPDLSGKLLFGQAFRAPSAWERSKATSWNVNGNRTVIKGNVGVPQSEKISTLEAQINYNAKTYEVSATYFNTSQSNLITLTQASDSALIVYFPTPPGGKKVGQMYVNSGTLNSYGVELEGKVYIQPELCLQGSASYQTTKDDKGRVDYRGMPKVMVKLGVSYEAPYGVSVGVFNSYYGEAGNIVPDFPTANPEYAPFNYLTANVACNLTKALNLQQLPDVVISLFGQNLLDEKINYKNYEARTINAIPGRAPRTIYGGLSVRL